jgi:hypothetical protein
MKNSTTHQALIELEESLKNLESARSQVENVSAKGEQVIREFAKVATQVEALHQEFELEKNGFGSTINKSLKNFDQQLAAKSDAISTKIKELNLEFSSNVNESIKKLYDFQKQVDIGQDAYKNSINGSFENFNQVLQKKSKEFTVKADELSNYFYKIISETFQKVKAFEEDIDAASEKILSLDFEKNFKEIKAESAGIRNVIVSTKEENNQLHLSLKDSLEQKFQDAQENIIDTKLSVTETIDKRFQVVEKKIVELNKTLNEQSQLLTLFKMEFQQNNALILEKMENIKKENKNASVLNLGIVVIGVLVILATIFFT